jgi:hypothetical protein
MPTLTYTAISKVVLTSSQSTITLDSIPQTYTDLVLLCSAKSTNNSSTIVVNVGLNGSTSNFTARLIDSYGSGAYATTDTRWILTATGNDSVSTRTNIFGSAEIYFPAYTSSAYKTISSTYAAELNEGGVSLGIIASLWSNTAAITSITLTQSGSFPSGCSFDLYGIKNS